MHIVTQIITMTAEAHGLTRADMLGKDRKRHLAYARHEAMWLARRLTAQSFPQIAARFELDHTTVMYAVRKVQRRLERGEPGLEDRLTALSIEFLRRRQFIKTGTTSKDEMAAA